MKYEDQIKNIILELYDIGGLKLGGEFKLKTGLISPIYIDLRVIVSYPKLLQQIADSMYDLVKNLKFDNICGVPYTALPIATVMSIKQEKPMVMRRKEVKQYGTGKIIEGVFQEGQTTLIIEDLVTSGLSVMETVQPLNDVGLKVTDVVVLVDRQQGGEQNLKNNNLNLHSLIPMSTLLEILKNNDRISQETADKVSNYIAQNQSKVIKPQENPEQKIEIDWSFEQRLKDSKSEMQKQILKIMIEKQTNLCVAADLNKSQEILDLADKIGAHICILKTHIDVIEDFSQDFVQKLVKISEKHNFLIFEDRKFADIGNTVKQQYESGVYKISEFSHIVNAHSLPGEGIVQGLSEVGLKKNKGLLLLAEMSSKGNLIDKNYTQKTIEMAQKYKDFVIGFISQGRISGPEFLYMTPGVNITTQTDALQQQYNSPQHIIQEKGSDIIIVGRGIYKNEDPESQAILYKQQGWKSYTERKNKL